MPIFLGVEVDPARIEKRLKSGYCDKIAWSLDEALKLIDQARKDRKSLSVGLVGNCADVLPEIVKRGIVPDVLTDQTSAHDALNGYVPHGMSLEDALAMRRKDPDGYIERAMQSMAVHVEAMLALQKNGAITFDYGNNIRAQAQKAGIKNAFDIPGFVPEYIRPLFCEGRGPFRWVALSGDPADIARTDKLALELFPKNQTLARWMKLAKERIHYQGLPARICWLGYGERAEFGVAINELVKSGEIKAPIVIGRDHLDTGSVASPNRETEGMLDGSDAIADWPLLNALINTAAGASWVSIHNGGGVGIGYSQHAGMVVVADGTENSKRRLERVLTSDPGMGILRHADAGYSRAIEFAASHNIDIPMKPQSARLIAQVSDSRKLARHTDADYSVLFVATSYRTRERRRTMICPRNQRAVLAEHLLGSLASVLHDEDEGVAEALRRGRRALVVRTRPQLSFTCESSTRRIRTPSPPKLMRLVLHPKVYS